MVLAPKATKVAPITNSVAATCSAAYKQQNVSNYVIYALEQEVVLRGFFQIVENCLFRSFFF